MTHIKLRALNRFTAPYLALVFFVMGFACGSDSPSSNPGSIQQTGDVQTLECEEMGYPCSIAEVPREILGRSDEIGDRVGEMLETGTPTDEIGAWLSEQNGMSEVDFDAQAVRFRLDGGVAMWILGDGIIGTRSAPGRPSERPPMEPPPGNAFDVVRPGSEHKKALVLSPFLWDFGAFAEGPEVAEILSGSRGYESAVTFLRNEKKEDAKVTVNSFKNWGDYDVVHLGTHGKRLCSHGTCRAVVFVGLLENILPPGPGEKIDKIAASEVLRERGVGIAKSKQTGTEYVYLTADFFREQYPGGLDDTVVFVSACQTFGDEGTDLAGAVKGPSSIFFGWSDVVFSGESKNAVMQFYEDVGKHGYPTEEAYARLGDLRVGTAAPGYGVPKLVMGTRSSGDLHIREVVTLRDPDTGAALRDGSVIQIVGDVDDGKDDSVKYRVRVDGLIPEQASDATLHVEIDGQTVEPQPVSDGTAGSNDQWTLTGEIDLGYDLESDKSATAKAWVQLPSGGESDHEVSVTISGSEPPMGYAWQLDLEWSRLPVGEPGDPAAPETATATLFLEYEEAPWIEPEKPSYSVTGGTVSYNHTHQDRYCEVEAPTVTFDITPEMAGISRIDFDLTTDPPTYSVAINTDGPRFEASYACRAGTGKDAPDGYQDPEPQTRSASLFWLYIPREKSRPTQLGTSVISGTVHEELPSSIRDTDYTFTRIK